VIDARPVQCLRLGGPTFIPLLAALGLGGFFILGTFHWWMAAVVSLVLGIAMVWRWLWVGTALAPEQPRKDVGLGLTLPLYVSGSTSVGWWAMLITMLAVLTAFISLVFAYFFFWTIHDDFPPPAARGPGVLWPCAGGGSLLGAWVATLLARRWNGANRASGFYLALATGSALALGGGAALLGGPWLTDMDPTEHVYPALVWMLALWTALHAVAGTLMQVYCLARRAAGRLTAQHDLDMCNTTLFWHFVAITAVITVGVIAGFPLVK
jgi:cytochrome c oxidase subunit I+III